MKLVLRLFLCGYEYKHMYCYIAPNFRGAQPSACIIAKSGNESINTRLRSTQLTDSSATVSHMALYRYYQPVDKLKDPHDHWVKMCHALINATCLGAYSLFALTLPLTLYNNTLLYGSQRSYGLKTTTAGTSTTIDVKRHSNRSDPILYSNVILVVGKKSAARSTRIDFSSSCQYTRSRITIA